MATITAPSFVLHVLPFEIIELISSYTTTQDLLSVIQVSKSWNQIFHTFMYRSLTIDTEEKQQRILSAFINHQLPGHYVRSLTLKKTYFSQAAIESMPKAFPEIDKLELDWSIWGLIDRADCYDPEAPISYIHPPRGLPPFIHTFFQHYGSHNLRHLTIDALNQDTTDMWSILTLCPRLKSLELLNLNHEHVITLGYLESIHQLCPQLTSLVIKCTRSDPDPAFLPQFNQGDHLSPILLRPTLLESFSLSSKSGASKWPLWLPYFSVKYPYLQHLFFKHLGLGKENDSSRSSQVPERVYSMFTQGCRYLKSIRWSKIIVQHDQQKGLFGGDQGLQQLQRIEAYENFLIPGALEFSPIVHSSMSSLLTSLTIGQPPANVTTEQVIKAIGGGCQRLKRLKIQECFVDPELAFDIKAILTHCKQLEELYFKDVHVNVQGISSSSSLVLEQNHPLKNLKLKRSSFTQNVFSHISANCPKLDHVELLGCFQSDRRDQVIINLPHQNLTTLKIQGLRAQRYYAGCRPRFFIVNDSWYYMTHYDIRYHPVGQKTAFSKFRNMEFARSFCKLQGAQAVEEQLLRLVTKETLKAWDIEAVTRNVQVPPQGIEEESWDPENIYYSGLVTIQCQSVQNLFINHKLII